MPITLLIEMTAVSTIDLLSPVTLAYIGALARRRAGDRFARTTGSGPPVCLARED
jgi:hypothetical protein